MDAKKLIEIRDLKVFYKTASNIFFKKKTPLFELRGGFKTIN
mgnify:CR=1 FL=1